ncbi:LTA synthase family protein [Evansella sp. AB-P1]|uniref:LTA synthase family protein n=1 Tax=Evansella sp. AB-P1 TaxID=3037653 RepID=UPI002420455D|nr:LTA synthase family protein [Evansella sp. AB-P1]MDG5787416.1 LTA synthase family protein [Evansella sp. AB-P1]
MKKFVKNHSFMLFCLVLLWLKTFIVSSYTFNININQYTEAIIFAFNPLAFLLIIFFLGLVFRPSIQKKYFLVITILLATVLYSNTVYYREFSDIITLPMLVMSANMGDLSTSIFELIQWYDIFYFLDVIIIGFLSFKKNIGLSVTQVSLRKSKSKYAVIGIAAITIFLMMQVDNSETRAHSFNRDHIVQKIGLYNFYIYDVFIHTTTRSQTVFADKDDWNRINEHLEKYETPTNEEFFGVAKDMNVISVSLESFENFFIGETVNGEEITPFLNEFIKESFYFDNFYYQTGQGKTSDAEFLINNSLYPLGRGAVFHTHDNNEYEALPEILSNEGYYTASFHANDGTFYNRIEMYETLGYDHYYDIDAYEITDENSVGWGLKDIDFVEQTMNYLTTIPQPFYSTLLTLTNHFPYELDEEDHFIEPYDSESEILNKFFPTVRYTDESMRIMVEQLKEKGLYENTIIVMYGDHYGLTDTHYDALGEFLGKEIGTVDKVKLEQVPLIIHIPGMEGETINTVSGQIDVMPTLLNLLGIPEKEDQVMFGSDLFSEERDDFVVLRNGTVITDKYIFHNDECFDSETGNIVNLENCNSLRDRAEWELFYSDKIIYGDLFRFR